MNVSEAIAKRKSVRAYLDKPVTPGMGLPGRSWLLRSDFRRATFSNVRYSWAMRRRRIHTATPTASRGAK